MKAVSTILAAATLFASSVFAQATVDPIVIKGQKFFYKTNGTQLYVYTLPDECHTGANDLSASSEVLHTSKMLAETVPHRQLLSNTRILSQT